MPTNIHVVLAFYFSDIKGLNMICPYGLMNLNFSQHLVMLLWEFVEYFGGA